MRTYVVSFLLRTPVQIQVKDSRALSVEKLKRMAMKALGLSRELEDIFVLRVGAGVCSDASTVPTPRGARVVSLDLDYAPRHWEHHPYTLPRLRSGWKAV